MNSEARVSGMLEAINKMDDVQNQIAAFATKLEKKTNDTINNTIESFN